MSRFGRSGLDAGPMQIPSWQMSLWVDAAYGTPTTHLRTNVMDFRGFDSSRILILRGGIPGPKGSSREV